METTQTGTPNQTPSARRRGRGRTKLEHEQLNVQVKILFTSKQAEKLLRKATDNGLSVSAYVRKMVRV